MPLKNICIEPTNTCNLQCPQCWSKETKSPKGFMDSQAFKKIVKEASEINIKKISLNFSGEPTLHHEFANMIKEVNNYKIPLSFATNGIELNDNIINELGNSAVTGINISLHNFNDLQKVFDNIRKLKEKVSSRFLGATVEVGEFSKKNLQFIKENCPIQVVVKPVIKDMQWFKIPENLTTKPAYLCSQVNRSMYILFDGRVTICCRDIASEMAFGNVFIDGLLGTWNSKRYIKIRTDIANKKFNLSLCKRCELWKVKFVNK